MGIVVRFSRVHARASSQSTKSDLRAAKATNVSAVTPALLATEVAKIGDHHSAGTLSRCDHLVTVGTLAPMSDAIASLESQSRINSRKDVICEAISKVIGQSVLKCKAILSLDRKLSIGHTVQMSDSETETEYKQRFMARVAAARIARNLKQWQIAEALGMPQDKYKQYEKRSLLPHHLIGRFCILTSVDPVWLVTGRGQKPLKAIQVVESEVVPVTKAKRGRSKTAA